MRLAPLFSLFILLSCAKVANYVQADRDSISYLSNVWTKNLDPVYETGNLPIALGGPFIHEGFLFAGDGAGKFHAYELSSGRGVWSFPGVGTLHASSMAYKDQVIFGTTQGRLISLAMGNGELKYSVDLGASVESTPTLHNDKIYLQTRNHQIFSIDAATGKILWSYKRSVPYLTTLQRVSAPVVYNGNLYVGFADGHVASFALEDGVLLWEQKLAVGTKFVDVDTTPYFHHNLLLIGSAGGPFSVINPVTGAITRQFELTPSRAPYKLSEERLLITTIEGELLLFDRDLKEVLKTHLGNSAISGVVTFKNSLVITNVKGEIFVVDPQSLELLERRELGHSSSAVFGASVVGEDHLAVLSSRNRLYVFK